ncbi:hypothetical protein D9757_000711 [Collybiopsis confluens]|uniref:Zinc-finger domain-containing protein n=1 Tax=Collybiopsis confluens TaxID=2823264 RepID=A0A8H5MGR6_9AGAR|nr:hypothetical protein D9757_000711 [Collybiopsis confluens]
MPVASTSSLPSQVRSLTYSPKPELFHLQDGEPGGTWVVEEKYSNRQEPIEVDKKYDSSYARTSDDAQVLFRLMPDGADNHDPTLSIDSIDSSLALWNRLNSPALTPSASLFTPEVSPEPYISSPASMGTIHGGSSPRERDASSAFKASDFTPDDYQGRGAGTDIYLAHVLIPPFPEDCTPAHYFKPHPKTLSKLRHASPSKLFASPRLSSASTFRSHRPSMRPSLISKPQATATHSRGAVIYMNLEDAMNASNIHNASEDYGSYANILAEALSVSKRSRKRRREKDEGLAKTPRKKIKMPSPPPEQHRSSLTSGIRGESLQPKKELLYAPLVLGEAFPRTAGDLQADRTRLYVGSKEDLRPGHCCSSGSLSSVARASNTRFVKENCQRRNQQYQTSRRSGLPNFLSPTSFSSPKVNGWAICLERRASAGGLQLSEYCDEDLDTSGEVDEEQGRNTSDQPFNRRHSKSDIFDPDCHPAPAPAPGEHSASASSALEASACANPHLWVTPTSVLTRKFRNPAVIAEASSSGIHKSNRRKCEGKPLTTTSPSTAPASGSHRDYISHAPATTSSMNMISTSSPVIPDSDYHPSSTSINPKSPSNAASTGVSMSATLSGSQFPKSRAVPQVSQTFSIAQSLHTPETTSSSSATQENTPKENDYLSTACYQSTNTMFPYLQVPSSTLWPPNLSWHVTQKLARSEPLNDTGTLVLTLMSKNDTAQNQPSAFPGDVSIQPMSSFVPSHSLFSQSQIQARSEPGAGAGFLAPLAGFPSLTPHNEFGLQCEGETQSGDFGIGENGDAEASIVASANVGERSSPDFHCDDELDGNAAAVDYQAVPVTINPSVLIGFSSDYNSGETKVYYSGDQLPRRTHQRIIRVLPKSQRPPSTKSRTSVSPNVHSMSEDLGQSLIASSSLPLIPTPSESGIQADFVLAPSIPPNFSDLFLSGNLEVDAIDLPGGFDLDCRPNVSSDEEEEGEREIPPAVSDRNPEQNGIQQEQNADAGNPLFSPTVPSASLPAHSSTSNLGLRTQFSKSLIDADQTVNASDSKEMAPPPEKQRSGKGKVKGSWPEGPARFFCHQCRRASYKLHMFCSLESCSLKYCVRCITIRYPGVVEFDASRGDFVCFRCQDDTCNCDSCCARRCEPYTPFSESTKVWLAGSAWSPAEANDRKVSKNSQVLASSDRKVSKKSQVLASSDRKVSKNSQVLASRAQQDRDGQDYSKLIKKKDWPRWCHQCRRKSHRFMECSSPTCNLKYCVRCVNNRYSREIEFDATRTDFLCFRCNNSCRCTKCCRKESSSPAFGLSALPSTPLSPIIVDVEVSEPVVRWGAVYNADGEAIATAYVSVDRDDVIYARPFPPKRRVFVGDVQPEWGLRENAQIGAARESEEISVDSNSASKNLARQFVGRPPPPMSAIIPPSALVSGDVLIPASDGEPESLEHGRAGYTSDGRGEVPTEMEVDDSSLVVYDSPRPRKTSEVDKGSISLNDESETNMYGLPSASTETPEAVVVPLSSPDADELESLTESARTLSDVSAFPLSGPADVNLDAGTVAIPSLRAVDPTKQRWDVNAAADLSDSHEGFLVTPGAMKKIQRDPVHVSQPPTLGIPDHVLSDPLEVTEGDLAEFQPVLVKDKAAPNGSIMPAAVEIMIKTEVNYQSMDFGSPLTEPEDT